MVENKYYVYLHIKETNGKPFYVGKGQGKRAISISDRNKWWYNTVDKYGFDIIYLETELTEEQALEKEIYWIKRIGRKSLNEGPLVNLTDGGEGTSGYVYTKIHREKLCKAMAGEGNGMYGKQHSNETKVILSLKASLWKRSESHMTSLVNAANEVRSKKIIDTNTGIVYKSIRKDSKEFGISHSYLSTQLSGKHPNKTTLKYLEIW